MKLIYTKYALLVALLLFPLNVFSQTTVNSIHKVSDRFYLMYCDTSAINPGVSKSAIVEFDDFIVLLELPLAYSNSHLVDRVSGGENVLQSLQSFFPAKPLKYVVGSHWHPHSLSAVAPFISRGIRIVSTEANFRKLAPMLDSATLATYGGNVMLMDQDTMTIQDGSNAITLYRVQQKTYSYLPTEDFIYTYVPDGRYLQTSCMYQRFEKSRIRGKEMISGRVENLYAFIQSRNLDVSELLCTNTNFDGANGLISMDTLNSLMRHGTGMLQVETELLALDAEFIRDNTDSLFRDLVLRPIPHAILQRAVSANLERARLREALELAKIHALLNPSDPRSWDLLGLAYYLSGEKQIAQKYEFHCQKMDPEFKDGMKSWEAKAAALNARVKE